MTSHFGEKMQVNKMNEYYSKRAQEYEWIYHRDDPVRQSEQNKIADVIKETFRNRNVLEVACGTGFWTTFLSEVAKSIVAIDNSDEVLKIAQSKHYKSPTYFQNVMLTIFHSVNALLMVVW